MHEYDQPRVLYREIEASADTTDDFIGYLLCVTWLAGYAQCQRDVAVLGQELDATWFHPPIPTYEEFVADRVDRMKAHAAATGQPEWRGTGAVNT